MGISLTASRASVATLAFLASNSSVNTLKIFAPGGGKILAKMLVGSLPKPGCLRPGADAPFLNFGTKCPKVEMPGNSKNCSPADRKMWKVFSNIRTGHIIILPPQKPRLETLANRAFFRAKCPHIGPAF